MRLSEYIDENGNHTNEKIFSERSSVDVFVNTEDLFMAQFINGNYNAMDVIVKYLAIENYFGLNNFGFNLYNEMQNARIGEIWELRFKDLIKSFEEKGYDNNFPIETDINYSIHDGAHRLALAMFLNIKKIKVRAFNASLTRKLYGLDWFSSNGFDDQKIEYIRTKYNEILNKFNTPYYCILWPPAYDEFSSIEKEIMSSDSIHSVVSKKDIMLNLTELKNLIYEVYSTDDIAKEKLDFKYQSIINSLQKKYEGNGLFSLKVFELILKNPDFKMKLLTGLPQSKASMEIKSDIRKTYSKYITDYQYDIIIHMTDNSYQNEEVKKILIKRKIY